MNFVSAVDKKLKPLFWLPCGNPTQQALGLNAATHAFQPTVIVNDGGATSQAGTKHSTVIIFDALTERTHQLVALIN